MFTKIHNIFKMAELLASFLSVPGREYVFTNLRVI
jgi:hypothetical protein